MRIKNNSEENGDIPIKEIDSIHRNIEKKLEKTNLNKIDSSKFSKVFDKKYVKYHRKKIQKLYNEIYIFLKEEKLPLRLIFLFMAQVEEYKRKREEQIGNKNIINPYTNKVNCIEDQNKKYKRKHFRELIKN